MGFDHVLSRAESKPPAASAVRHWLIARRSHWMHRAELPVSDEAINWVVTIRAAGEDFALPALATLLKKAGLLDKAPADVQRFLNYALAQNVQVNQRVREQCLEIGTALRRAGLFCVLLKGAVWLFEEGPAAEDRMLRDIDLLVPPVAAERARSVLSALGYAPSATAAGEPGHIHDVPLEHPERLVSVELHVALTTRIGYLNTDEVLSGVKYVAPGLFAPAPRHRIVHNVVHAQIFNGDYAGGVLSLRDSLDLGRLIGKNISLDDWSALANDARRRGYFPALSGAMHKAAYVSGVIVPEPFRSDRAGRRHLRRCVLQRHLPAFDWMMRKFGVFCRATAWERDAYALRLGNDRGMRAHILVNRRRLARIRAALRRQFRSGRPTGSPF